jgi:hypothetical protein
MGAWYHRNKEEQYRRNQESKAEDPEKWKKWARDSYHRRKNDPEKVVGFLLKDARVRAKKKNVPYELTEEDLLPLPTHCPVMGVPFDKSRRYSRSLDRIIPEKGYVKGNVQIISQLANAMKWDSTSEERLAFAKWVLASEGGLPLC